MREVLSIVMEIVGLAWLVYGYSKNNRKHMLAAALLLWFGGSLNDFVRGFMAGASAVH